MVILLPTETQMKRFVKLLLKREKDVSKLAEVQVHQQIFENNGADTVLSEFEKSVNKLLNKNVLKQVRQV